MSFLLCSIDYFANNFFCVIFHLHFHVRIQIFHLLVLADLLILSLPFCLCLSIYLRDITFSSESYFGETDEFIRQGLYLLAKFLVRLATLIYVLLNNLCIIVHSHLALVNSLNHVGSLLGDTFDDTLQVLHSLHPLVVFVWKEVFDIKILFFFLYMVVIYN